MFAAGPRSRAGSPRACFSRTTNGQMLGGTEVPPTAVVSRRATDFSVSVSKYRAWLFKQRESFASRSVVELSGGDLHEDDKLDADIQVSHCFDSPCAPFFRPRQLKDRLKNPHVWGFRVLGV